MTFEAINFDTETRNFCFFNVQEAVGAFGLDSKNFFEANLFELDSYDLKLIEGAKIKKGCTVYRYQTDKQAVHGWKSLISINLEKGLVYFMTEEALENDFVQFETKGQKCRFGYISKDAI